MNIFKKITAIFILSVLLIMPVCAETIYEDIKETPITRGIMHKSVKTFSENGWVRYNLLTVDLTDDALKLKVMTSSDGISKLSTVKTMAENYNAKVALNADFFNPSTSDTNMLGMLYQDGKMLSTPSLDKFATFFITENNEILFDYFDYSATLYAENTSLCELSSCPLYQINKAPLNTGAITMITSAWGQTVTIPEICYAMICEPNGENLYKMTGFSWGGEAVSIPENGAVFIAHYPVNGFLNTNFAMGDTIRVELEITPDTSKIKEASGGNTLIVKDGEIATFTSDIAGYAQRSAMGVSKDGKTMYLVAVDGRQPDFSGFTQTELARLMIEIGAENAINLDGGGSTTMVADNRFTNKKEVLNSVSSLRKVSTAIGVISTLSPTNNASGIEIKLSESTIAPSGNVTVNTAITDENFNSIPHSPSDIVYTCSDETAVIDSNTITFTKGGKHKITAKYKDLSAEAYVYVLDDIFAINIFPEKLDAGKTASVTAYDKKGYSATIPVSSLSFSTTGDVIMEGAKVVSGEGTVTAKYNGLTSSAYVKAPFYERPLDIKVNDAFEGFIPNTKEILITGEILKSQNLIGRLSCLNALDVIKNHDNAYALSTFTNYFDTAKNINEVSEFSEKTIENTKLITFANYINSSFLSTEKSGWSSFKKTVEETTEKNVIILTNEPIYNMKSGEIDVFKHYLKLLTDKGINVFVVSTGEKSEVTTDDGVRYIYLGKRGDCTVKSYFYEQKSAALLRFYLSGDKLRYSFD